MKCKVKTVGYFSSVEIGLDYVESNFQNMVLQYDDIMESSIYVKLSRSPDHCFDS